MRRWVEKWTTGCGIYISQIGSPEKLEEYYQKSILEIKEEMREIIKEQMMEKESQEKITKRM